MKKTIGVLLILYSLLFTVACPVKPADLVKIKDSSAKVATYANTGVNLTRSLYESHILSLAQKDSVAQKFVILANAGIAFDAAVAAVQTQYGDAAVPKSEIERLVGVFNDQVVNAFLEVLTSLKVISSKGSYAATIDLIREAVLLVANVFNIKGQVLQRIEATAWNIG